MINTKAGYRFFLLVILAGTYFSATAQPTNSGLLTLWYERPAATWNEALPVGNGSLGAMIFGGISSERLQLNEESVWSGKKEDFVNPEAKATLPVIRNMLFAGQYKEAEKLAQEKLMGRRQTGSSYQTLGDLWLDFDHQADDIQSYQRELNLKNAVASVKYRVKDIEYTREIFSSAPDRVLALRITANKKSAVCFRLRLSRPGNKASVQVNGNQVTLSEHVNDGVGVRLVTTVKVQNEGGDISTANGELQVDKADAVTILLTAATDYRGTNPAAVVETEMAAAARMSFSELKERHIADYQQYFNRVTLDIGANSNVLQPTDERLASLQHGTIDPALVTLYYQYGRYLLISSSRPGSLPANLQGIWADGLNPPWDADYHININIQMNYWPAEITNLTEMHGPFLAFVNALRNDGRKTAADMYGKKGAVAHFTTDAWLFTETYGRPQWAMWPMGLAWSVRHLWEHYLFTEDKVFLANDAYPALKEAAQFCLSWLVKDPATGRLVSGPSISPENTFRTKNGEVATVVMGPTMDHMIIRELFTNTMAAAALLNRDKRFRRQLAKALTVLAPTKIGSDGRIMEWTEEFDEPEPGHRHISHLYGLYPGNEINSTTPAMLAAAKKTIAHRLAHGGGHTGWSRAWMINFFARLKDGEAAYENLMALLKKSTLPNLFDNHPPFQIDGNFGGAAGITEMLLQSGSGEVELLPALPKAWPAGFISGLVARGGFEVSLEWKNGRLASVGLLSRLGNRCRVKYGNNAIDLATEKGKRYRLDSSLQLAQTE